MGKQKKDKKAKKNDKVKHSSNESEECDGSSDDSEEEQGCGQARPALLRGDFRPLPAALLDSMHMRFKEAPNPPGVSGAVVQQAAIGESTSIPAKEPSPRQANKMQDANAVEEIQEAAKEPEPEPSTAKADEVTAPLASERASSSRLSEEAPQDPLQQLHLQTIHELEREHNQAVQALTNADSLSQQERQVLSDDVDALNMALQEARAEYTSNYDNNV